MRIAPARLPNAVNQSTSDLQADRSVPTKNRSSAFCSFQCRSGRLFEETVSLLRRSRSKGPPPPTFTAPLLHCSIALSLSLFSFEFYGTVTKYHRIMDNSQFSRLIDFQEKIDKSVHVNPRKSPSAPPKSPTKTVLKRSVVEKMPCIYSSHLIIPSTSV